MIKRSILDRFRELINPEELDGENDEERDYPVENLINIALVEFKKWASPIQYQKLIESLKTNVYRKSETRLYHNLKLYSKRLGDTPREVLEEVLESIEPETIVEKVPVEVDNWIIDGVSLVNNIDGKAYYEVKAHDKADESQKKTICVHDGEFVDSEFARERQFDGSRFTYGEAYIGSGGGEKFVIYMEKQGRAYDEITHLFDFDIRRLAYHARTDEDQFVVVEDKGRFGQFDYSVHTGQIIKDHAKELSKRGAREIVDVIDRIDPIVYRKTMRLVNTLKRFSNEFLSTQQKIELTKIVSAFYGEA